MKPFDRLMVVGRLVAILSALSACGLVEDLRTVTVSTDWEEFEVDASSFGLSGTLPRVDCTSDQTLCDQVTCPASEDYTCAAKCLAGACALDGAVEKGEPVDLSGQIPDSASSVLESVELDSIIYNVMKNTFNTATPEVELLVGPDETGGIAKATRLGVLPSLPVGSGEVNEAFPLEAAGSQALRGFVLNYKTPFRIYAKSALTFVGGQPVPAGLLKLRVKAKFRVRVF
ncbi:MAG: hypothetical protein H6707_08580 [Deltaproteobacteria bacterium]|nr:hypothetical protein [Deltaproteobacteria bacterium]